MFSDKLNAPINPIQLNSFNFMSYYKNLHRTNAENDLSHNGNNNDDFLIIISEGLYKLVIKNISYIFSVIKHSNSLELKILNLQAPIAYRSCFNLKELQNSKYFQDDESIEEVFETLKDLIAANKIGLMLSENILSLYLLNDLIETIYYTKFELKLLHLDFYSVINETLEILNILISKLNTIKNEVIYFPKDIHSIFKQNLFLKSIPKQESINDNIETYLRVVNENLTENIISKYVNSQSSTFMINQTKINLIGDSIKSSESGIKLYFKQQRISRNILNDDDISTMSYLGDINANKENNLKPEDLEEFKKNAIKHLNNVDTALGNEDFNSLKNSKIINKNKIANIETDYSKNTFVKAKILKKTTIISKCVPLHLLSLSIPYDPNTDCVEDDNVKPKELELFNNNEINKNIKSRKEDLNKIQKIEKNKTLENLVLAVGLENGDILLYDLMKTEIIGELCEHEGAISNMRQIDDTRFCSSSIDKSIKIWDFQNGICLKTFFTYSPVKCLLVMDQNKIISTIIESNIAIWNINKAFLVESLNEHTRFITALAKLNSSTIASTGADYVIKIWEINLKKCIKSFSNYSQVMVLSLSFLDKEKLAVCDLDYTVVIYNFRAGTVVYQRKFRSAFIYCIKKLNKTNQVAFGFSSGKILYFDFEKNQKIKKIKSKHNKEINAVELINNQYIATCSNDLTIRFHKY